MTFYFFAKLLQLLVDRVADSSFVVCQTGILQKPAVIANERRARAEQCRGR